MAPISEDTAERLNELVRAKTGDPGARAHSLEVLPGHAGFSYSFVLDRTRADAPSGKLVIRIAPPGVKISARNFGRDRRYPITNAFRDARD